jgi:hypothetical protein
MERTNLTSTIAPYINDSGAAAGTTAERSTYVFPTQGLRSSILDLLNLARTNGVPMDVTAGSDLASMFTVPKIALSNMSCAAALAELMAWVPDSVCYFDYSGSSGSWPGVRIARRKSGLDYGSMPTRTLAVGTDAVDHLALSPRLDLEVQQVDLNFVTRNTTTGRPQWAAQSSGTASAHQFRQIIAVSGPEIVQYLPKDDFESIKIQTATGISDGIAIIRDSTLALAKKTYGSFRGSIGDHFTTYSGSTSASGAVSNVVADRMEFPPLYAQRENGRYITGISSKYFVMTGDLPEWAVKKYAAYKVKITGTWIYYESSDAAASAVFLYFQGQGQWGYGATSSRLTLRNRFVGVPISFDAWIVNASFPSSTDIYKPWDYDYITPPAGLASDLRQAQNWVPWEGSISIVSDSVTGDNDLRYKLNVTNALPACATMGAILNSVNHDIFRGRTTYGLGAPARLDFGSLVNKIRRQPSDNIVYL